MPTLINFSHTNIIKYANRPFASTEEHDQTLIVNWNSRVRKDDSVYFLGDFGWGSTGYLKTILNKLNGKIYFIRGNHDRAVLKGACAERFEWIKDTHFLNAEEEGQRYQIFLSHYPHRSWNRMNQGAYMLYGHCHSNMPPYGLSFDIGVDCWNYFPVSLQEIKAKMDTLKLLLDYDPNRETNR